MSLTVAEAQTGASNSAAVTITLAAGSAIGDFILAIASNDFDNLADIHTLTGTAVSSWTLQGSFDGGTNLSHVKVFTGTVSSAGAKTIVLTTTDINNEHALAVYRITGGAAFDVMASNSGASSTSHVAPSVTAADAAGLLFCHWTNNDGGGGVYNYTYPASPFVSQTERDLGTFQTFGWAYKPLSASGSTGTVTATASVAHAFCAVTVALKNTAAYTPGPITSVGSLVTHTNNTSAATEAITLAPAAVGNLICLAIETKWTTLGTDDFYVSSMSGGGVSTWNQRAQLKSADNIHNAELWWGVVTATGSSTLTVTYTAHASNGTGASSIDAQEYSFNNAGTIWVMDVAGTSDPNTNVTTMPWPTLAPAMGLGNEAYFGYMAVTSSVTPTALTGFTFTNDARGNPCAVSSTVSASVSPQATGTSQKYFSIAMLIAATVAADLPEPTNSPRTRLNRASCF